jgi:ATP/maltotriose-dependent transcriptional regulator MalT
MLNKITKLYNPAELTEQAIQDHLDELNADGWFLVTVDNMGGWYRFFWAKTSE